MSGKNSQSTTPPQPKRSTRFIGYIVGAVLVVAVVAMFVSATRSDQRRNAERLADERAREAAVAAYAQQISTETNGAISINTVKGPDDSENRYAWNSRIKALTVNVQLGGCKVKGAFPDMPTRPGNVSEIGELTLVLPSVNSEANSSTVKATEPDLYSKIMASGLAHCVAGDRRLLPNYSG